MLIIAVALASLLYSLEMPPKGVNCMSLNVPNAERCIVCRNPNSANVRRNHGRKCLRAKEDEQQADASQAVESGSCEPSAPQVSCSCCSPPNFLPAGSPLFGASSSDATAPACP